MKNLNVRQKNMAKFAALVISAGIAVSTLSGCGNKDLFDTVYTYTHAVVIEDGKTTIIPIKQWTDYDGEQIQIITEYGNPMLTSTNHTFLFSEKNGTLSVEDFATSLSNSDAEITYLEKQDQAKIKQK